MVRYAPPGMCLNDFAVIGTAPYTLLHLQGPWTPEFDATRLETSYGRATSDDLVTWRPEAPAFGVGVPGRFDDAAVWTMHPFPHGTGLAMAYTGVTLKPEPHQAIGLAYADRGDGTGWLRTGPEPATRPDPRWYRVGPDAGWRDPWIVAGALPGAAWAMLTAAQTPYDPLDRAGCVGLSISDDLERWSVQPPLLVPGDVHELECPILEPYADGWLLLASIAPQRHIEAWWASTLDGAWERLGPIAPPGPYAPRLVDGPDGQRLVLHTVPRRVGLTDSGEPCRGMLAQPKVLRATPAGPRLGWWSGLDAHLGPPQDAPATDAVVDVRLDGAPGAVTVRDGLTVTVTGRGVALDGPAGRLQAAPLPRPAATMRALAVGEYVEVYLDDVLALSTTSYATRERPVIGSNGQAVVRPLRLPREHRDDVSALRPPG